MTLRFLAMSSVVASLLAAVGVAQALTVAPAKVNLIIDPGKEQLISMQVRNDSDERQQFSASTGGVKQDEVGRPRFGTGFDVAESWVSPPQPFFLDGHAAQTVIFTVRAPRDAEPGTHYVALYVSERPGQGQVGLAGQTAVLAAINVAGSVQEALSIDAWRPGSFIQMKSTWPMAVALKNNGTVSLPLNGQVTVANWLGKITQTKEVSLGNELLPQTFRQITIPTQLEKIMLPGPYRLSLDVRYGLSRTTAVATATVWYLPPWSIILVIILGLFVFRARRRRV